MANRLIQMNEPKEKITLEDSSDNKIKDEIEKHIEIEMTSTNPKQGDKKQLKACDEDSYVVKLFKSIMSFQEYQNSVGKKN
ncbi:hypothetical protein PUN28_000259 [Cardiocondyla obscurior]|uniref:Uncharacterized protein n=1 Tax=Cardiocondyla obscurior TaxID=286306 RepID=A0AAW2GYG0_9HYME